MEKWKVVVIMLLIGALGGYGAYQSVQSNAPVADPRQQPPVKDGKPAKVQTNFVGKKLPQWKIPANYWINTRAPVTLKDLEGSIAIVEVFRISCSHCQAEAPILVDTYNKYVPRGLKIVSIQAPGTAPEENDWKQVQSTVKGWGFKQPVAFDNQSEFFKNALGGLSYPSVYILDKKGIVQYQQTGETDEKTAEFHHKLSEIMGG